MASVFVSPLCLAVGVGSVPDTVNPSAPVVPLKTSDVIKQIKSLFPRQSNRWTKIQSPVRLLFTPTAGSHVLLVRLFWPLLSLVQRSTYWPNQWLFWWRCWLILAWESVNGNMSSLCTCERASCEEISFSVDRGHFVSARCKPTWCRRVWRKLLEFN